MALHPHRCSRLTSPLLVLTIIASAGLLLLCQAHVHKHWSQVRLLGGIFFHLLHFLENLVNYSRTCFKIFNFWAKFNGRCFQTGTCSRVGRVTVTLTSSPCCSLDIRNHFSMQLGNRNSSHFPGNWMRTLPWGISFFLLCPFDSGDGPFPRCIVFSPYRFHVFTVVFKSHLRLPTWSCLG